MTQNTESGGRKPLSLKEVVGLIVASLMAIVSLLAAGDWHGYDRGLTAGEANGFERGVAIGEVNGYQRGLRDQQANSDSIREWRNVEELRWWLAANNVSERDTEAESYDCDNQAIDLSIAAARRQRVIGLWLETGGEKSHMANFAIIGNKIYSIEPGNDAVEFLMSVDRPYTGSEVNLYATDPQ